MAAAAQWTAGGDPANLEASLLDEEELKHANPEEDVVYPTPGDVVEAFTSGFTPDVLKVFFSTFLFMTAYGLGRIAYPLVLVDTMGSIYSAAYVQGALHAAQQTLAFLIANPILGTLSDFYGRRKFMLIAACGLCLEMALIAHSPTLRFVMIGSAIRGTTNCFVAVAASALAELSPEGAVGKNMGLIGVAYGSGMAIGTLAGGFLGEHYGNRAAFLAGACLAGCCALFTMVGLLPLNRNVRPLEELTLSKFSPVNTMGIIFQTPALRLLSLVFTLFMLGMGAYETWILYTRYRFGWSSQDLGIFMFTVGVSIILVQGIAVRLLFSWLGECRALLLGLIVSALELFAVAFATEGWMLYCIVIFMSLGASVWPAARGLFARQVSMYEQGQLQGALGCLHTLSEIIAPLIASEMLGFAVQTEVAMGKEPGSTPLLGLPFILAGISMSIGALIWWSKKHVVEEGESKVAALADAELQAECAVEEFKPA